MNIDLEINMLLDDIKSTLFYLNNPNLEFDVDELIMYLSTVDESINTIKTLLLERKN